MKRFFIKLIVSFFLAMCLTIIIYWPIYQRIELNDSSSDISTEMKRLDLPIGQELKEVIINNSPIPLNRHQLCLKNDNRVYLIHTDSDYTGFLFKTNDISQQEDMRETEIGAMAIEIYYKDGLKR